MDGYEQPYQQPSQAARRFRAILATIATDDEAARTRIILPDPDLPKKTSEELVAELQALSVHPVDPLLVPIKNPDHCSDGADTPIATRVHSIIAPHEAVRYRDYRYG
jgi:hypothetical protein